LRRSSLNQDYPELCGEHRRSADSERFLSHAGTLWGRVRRGRRRGGEYCRRSCAPFALLLSRIRNVFTPYKNGKNA